jgi:hypothetical protein
MKRAHWFKGRLGGAVASLLCFGRKKKPVTSQDLKKVEFRTSTQRMGLGMTDHIRDCFRFRWLRKQ